MTMLAYAPMFVLALAFIGGVVVWAALVRADTSELFFRVRYLHFGTWVWLSPNWRPTSLEFEAATWTDSTAAYQAAAYVGGVVESVEL